MLLFAHLPKAGGTSITYILIRFLESNGFALDRNIISYGHRFSYDDLALLDDLKNIKMISGHLRKSHFEKVKHANPFVLTNTRDSFSRFCSRIEHACRLDKSGPIAQHAKPLKGTVDKIKIGTAALIDARGSESATIEALDLLRSYTERWQNREDIGDFNISARVDITEIDYFIERLSKHAPIDNLISVSKSNIHTKVVWNQFSKSEMELVKVCYESLFTEEILADDIFKQKYPSVFEPDVFDDFIDSLLDKK